jgi:dihydrofolate synthase / folylpolyglutamate synthase
MKFGLGNIRLLMDAVGHPERAFRAIHIAGTNGKGSTACMVASVLTESGYRTGLYTSPHLVRFTERIRINGKQIPTQRLVKYVRHLRPLIEHTRATFFEATTCIAFLYFADEGIDVGVIETGLGGRLDATNVLLPDVSVITSIGIEHTEYLGGTIPKIAREKGGIIKRGVPLVLGAVPPDADRVLRGIAQRRGSSVYPSGRRVALGVSRGGAVRFRGKNFHVRGVRLGLPGVYQHTNVRCAVAVFDVLKGRRDGAYGKVTNAALGRGLRRVVRNTGLRGRMERLAGGVVLDVAHNPDGVRALVGALGTHRGRNRVVVFGAMKDKDVTSMLEELSRLADTLVAVVPHTGRALAGSELVRIARRVGIQAVVGGSVRRGLVVGRRLAGRGGNLLVTGSHYVIGEAIASLERGNP